MCEFIRYDLETVPANFLKYTTKNIDHFAQKDSICEFVIEIIARFLKREQMRHLWIGSQFVVDPTGKARLFFLGYGMISVAYIACSTIKGKVDKKR